MDEAPRAEATVGIDNERVRATTWRFVARATTGWHRHELPYVIVPLANGALALTGPDGATVTAELEAGRPYFRDAGVEHDVANVSDGPFAFVEIELKR